MAKIDVTKIEGFDEMSIEDKLKVLQEFEMPEPDYTGYIQKTAFDKTASELAELKRQSKAKLTEDEKKQQERDEQFTAMQSELEQLRKDKLLATTKSSYLGLGYDETMATEISQYVIDGNTEKVFATQKKFLAEYKKNIEKELANNVPPPASGSSTKELSKAEFQKLSPQDRAKFAQENQEAYKLMYEPKGD